MAVGRGVSRSGSRRLVKWSEPSSSWGLPVARACQMMTIRAWATTMMALFFAMGLRWPPHLMTCRW